MARYPRLIEKIVCNPIFYKFLGFTIVRNVMDRNSVEKLRSYLLEVFPGVRVMQPRDVFAHPDLYNVVFLPKIVKSLKLAFGENYSQWCDFQVQKNLFGGWHTDSGSESNMPYLYYKNYGFAKCGLYLQDNTVDFGGGVAIKLFSHLNYLSQSKIYRKIFQPIFNLLTHNIKINAGDFLFFDSRLLHSSCYPKDVIGTDKTVVINIAQKNAKYAIYWDACNSASWEYFKNNAMTRSLSLEFGATAPEIFFTDYLSRFYPDDFPQDFIQNIEKNKLHVPTLLKQEANFFKKLLDEMASSVSSS